MPMFIIVTGATGAIGGEIAARLVAQGENVVLACRNIERARQKCAEIASLNPDAQVRVAALDLADIDSIHAFVDRLKADGIQVKGLINNAGVMNHRFCRDSRGIEQTMAVNFLNTRLLTELMIAAYPDMRRVVFTTSLTRFINRRNRDFADGKPLDINVSDRHYHPLLTYGRSKRALTDYAIHLSRTAPAPVTVACADPGVVDSGMISMHRWYDCISDLIFRPLIRTPRQGADPALRAWYGDAPNLIYCRHRTRRLC